MAKNNKRQSKFEWIVGDTVEKPSVKKRKKRKVKVKRA